MSVVCESVAVADPLRVQAERLLGPLGWHGVAMLEYKVDRRTGQPVLMEVNGRFWGSLQLAVDAGVDFPYLASELAMGRPVQGPDRYHIGVSTRWWLGDLDHLLLRLFRSDRDLPEPKPSRIRAVIDFAVPSRAHRRGDVFRLDDPVPAIRELRQYASALTSSTARRLRRPAIRPPRTRAHDAVLDRITG